MLPMINIQAIREPIFFKSAKRQKTRQNHAYFCDKVTYSLDHITLFHSQNLTIDYFLPNTERS